MLSVRIRPGLPEKDKAARKDKMEDKTIVVKEKKIKSTSAKQDTSQKVPGFQNFFQDTKMELRRVSWPNREAVFKATVLILIIVSFSTLFVAGTDWILARIFMVIKGL